MNFDRVVAALAIGGLIVFGGCAIFQDRLRHFPTWVAAGVVLWLAAAPAAAAEVAGAGFGTYTWLRRNVLPTCMYCHVTVPGVSFASHAETLRQVVPGEPEKSRMYIMVASRRMPKGRGGLPAEQIQAIYEWIRNGAKDD